MLFIQFDSDCLQIYSNSPEKTSITYIVNLYLENESSNTLLYLSAERKVLNHTTYALKNKHGRKYSPFIVLAP